MYPPPYTTASPIMLTSHFKAGFELKCLYSHAITQCHDMCVFTCY